MVLKDCRSGVVLFEGKQYPVRVVTGIDNNVALYFKDELQDSWMKKAEVSFNDSVKGCIKTTCDILIKRNPGYPIMKEAWMGECQILDVIEIVQRQQDIRVNVSIQVQFTSEKEYGKRFFGTITNLSAGGIFMVTSEELTIGEILSFHYAFKNIERTFRLKILWGKLYGPGENGYGLKFLDLSEGAETSIRGFVFNELREQRMKNSGG
ncbi:PilZ domain-containing protein [Oribacterium sp. P6A1]|uniref:PilZ domain-containing protein n=1 Tax=Oribacterium sp. P6A1 TaxID=1410612 RepID=UPI00055D6E7E|nr:PilZ domain-containing protein [Oribacterium sp. P6A1]